MATAELQPIEVKSNPIVKYEYTVADIAKLGEEYGKLTADTREGYEACRVARQKVVKGRTGTDAKRKEMIADSRAYIDLVNGMWKEIEAAFLAVEGPLVAKIKAVDDAKEAEKRAKAEAERQRIEADLRKQREAEEARLKAERDAEEKKMAEVRAEQEKIAAAQKAKADELAAIEAKQKEAQDRIDAARREIEAAKTKADREEELRQATIKAAAEATERIRREAEAAKKQAAEAERKAAEEAKRIEALRPDAEKIISFATKLHEFIDLECPAVSTDAAKLFLVQVEADLTDIANSCESFGK